MFSDINESLWCAKMNMCANVFLSINVFFSFAMFGQSCRVACYTAFPCENLGARVFESRETCSQRWTCSNISVFLQSFATRSVQHHNNKKSSRRVRCHLCFNNQFYKGNCWSCLHMSCLYSCIVVDGHRRVETGNIFKDGDVGGGDTYHVSCEYQLSHVCSVVLTWC